MRPERAEVLVHGLVAGFIGYAAVVIFFALVNVIGGHSPFHTAARLGTALFYEPADPLAARPEPGPVLAYNGVHLVASLLAGTGSAFLLVETERYHFLWYFVFFLFLAGFVYVLLFVGILGAEITRVIPWWFALMGTLVWVAAMGGYLWTQHRSLLARLSEEQGAES
jgi:hypothetical protein